MPVKPRNAGYEATVHYKGERYRKSFVTKVEAEAWELQLKADLKRGLNIQEITGTGKTSGPRNIMDLMNETARVHWRGTANEKNALTNALKCVEGLGANLHPTMVTSAAVMELVFMFEAEGTAPATINRRLSALSKMMTHAMDMEYITRKPKIPRKREPEGRIRFVTAAEEEAMLAFFTFTGNQDMHDLIVMGVDTGMRLSEMRNLNSQRVHFDTGSITVTDTKNGATRTLPMTERVRELLKRRVAAAEAPTDALWLNYTNRMIEHQWDRAKAHMKLQADKQFVPHTMRHTFCSRLVQRGVPLQVVSLLAGHKTISVTMRYAHMAPQNLVDAMKVLEPVKQEAAA